MAFPPPVLQGPCMRAFATRHVGWGGYEGYILLFEFFVAFGHLPGWIFIQKEKEKKVSTFRRAYPNGLYSMLDIQGYRFEPHKCYFM